MLFSPTGLGRALIGALACASLCACGGGGSSSTGTGSVPTTAGQSCAVNVQATLARPAPGQTGVGNINTIEIVANSNNNNLYTSYQSYNLLVTPSGANPLQGISTNFLSLTSDNSGPHPYGSDYYYNANVGENIPSGYWDVYLNVPQSGCQPYYLGSFGT